jgi:hypothetical protein
MATAAGAAGSAGAAAAVVSVCCRSDVSSEYECSRCSFVTILNNYSFIVLPSSKNGSKAI